MTFAIDYDGTYAEAPLLFNQFIATATKMGHKCVLVTQRTEATGAEVVERVGHFMPIVFAGGYTKADATLAAGYEVDVWIDDEPIGVFVARTYVGP